MKRTLNFVLMLVLAAWMVGTAEAQVRKAGLTGASFLKIGVGARAVALGSATTTVRNDVNQMFWNPAGISVTDGKMQVTFSYNDWIADLSHYAAGVSRGIGSWGTIGIGFVALGVSDIDANRDVVPTFLLPTLPDTYLIDPVSATVYDYNDTAVSVTWAYQFTDRLSMGLTGKYISQKIDDLSASAVAVDAGVIYDIGYKGARIGARINNLGSDLKFYEVGSPLPLVFSIGSSIDLLENIEKTMRFTAMVDATKPQDGEQLVFIAGEVQAGKHLMLRGGYKLNYSGTSDNKSNALSPTQRFAPNRTAEGYTLGAGLSYPTGKFDIGVDYAFTEFGILNNVHRISLNFGF